MSDLANILGHIDQGLMDFTKEAFEGINRAGFQQGDATKANDKDLKNTWHYLGGVKISNEGLNEEQMAKADGTSTQKKDETKTYSVFKNLDVVVLAYSYNRRFYTTPHGSDKKTLYCGSNQAGKDAIGANGQHCGSCEFNKYNMKAAGYDVYNTDHCNSNIDVLAYIPLIDHVCIIEFSSSKYQGGKELLDTVTKLCRDFAKRPDVQKAMPGLKRANSFMFKVNIGLGPHQPGANQGTYQDVEVQKLAQPYEWEKILLSGDLIAKAKQALQDNEDQWRQLFEGEVTSAFVAKQMAQIGTSQAQQITGNVEKVTLPEAVTAQVVDSGPAPVAAVETQQIQSTDQAPAFVEAAPTLTEMELDTEDEGCPW